MFCLTRSRPATIERARLEKKNHNFQVALPEYLAEQADEALKSSYNLEFLGIQREVRERELEDRLIAVGTIRCNLSRLTMTCVLLKIRIRILL